MAGAERSSLSAVGWLLVAALAASGLLPLLSTPVREVLAVLRARVNPDETDVQTHGCQAVLMRSIADIESRDAVVWAGFLDQAVLAIRSHPMDKDLQKWCAGAIAAVSRWHPETVAAAARAGAVEELVQSMSRFPEDPEMQQASNLGLLLVRSPENRIRWAAAGGMEANAASIRRLYNDSSIQYNAWCLFASGTGEPNEVRFHDIGGIELAVQVLRDHMDSLPIREQVLNSMRAICAHSDRLRSAVLASGFVEAAVQASRQTPGELSQQALVCGNFGNLAEGDEGHREALLAAGAIDVAALAVRTAPDMRRPADGEQGVRYTVYGECFKALEALALSEKARPAIAAAVTREEIIAGMRAEPEDWKVQTGGSALLRLLMD